MLGSDPIFDCDGEMAVRLASLDWASTPLGPIDSWSQSLRTSAGIILRSRYPMLLSWGEHLVMLYNDAFIPTLGAKHPQAVGGLLPEVFAEVWPAVGPMQRSVLAGGPATWDEDLRLTIERGTGPEECFFTFSYSHVPDEGPGPGGVLAVLTVTTDKVVAARRLELLNGLARVANQATTPDQAMTAALDVLAKAELDLRGGGLYAPGDDAADTLHCTGRFGEMDGALVPDVISSADHPAMKAWHSRTAVSATTRALVEGVERPRSWTALPVRGQEEVESVLVLFPHPLRPFDETHERFVALVADQLGQILAVATSRAHEHARLEALAALDAAKTAFLSNVSHEFRTPLTLLLAPLEDVLAGREEAIGRTEAEVMHSSAHRLLRMVNGLLDVARIEAEGLTATPESTDLVQLTRDLLQPFEMAAARAGLVLETELDPQLGVVLADPALWEKIVVNLLANAIKFTPSGSIVVSCTARDEHVVLTVADSGLGIPATDIGHVFDRFHRVRNSGGRNIEGAGIGLTLVAEAARAMGGAASVESQPGRGSTFEVVLPLVRGNDGARPRWRPDLEAVAALAADTSSYDEPAPSSTVLPHHGTGGPVILVVEDNPAMRSRIERLLATLGEVVTAPDGQEALEILRAGSIDLVVTDVMMPRLDGLGLLEAIRGDDRLRSTPVILLSARAGSEAAAGAIEAGADDYVVKPFTSGELLARCRMSLELAEYRASSAAIQGRSALLAGVSHDMQTPLAVVTTSLSLLAELDLDDEQRQHLATRAGARAAQLARLVTQFLDWSRLNMSQPLPVRVEPVDLAEVVAEVAAEHEGVRVTCDPDPAVSWCDRQRTAQILHNLVENARRAARSRTEIRLVGDDDTCRIRVVDDGAGVHPDVLPRLFEAFGPSTSVGGNGLGLHVSREAATAQGGALELESTGPDGSVFLLSVPRSPR